MRALTGGPARLRAAALRGALRVRQPGSNRLVARQLRVALGTNRSQPDERVPPIDNHRRRPAE